MQFTEPRVQLLVCVFALFLAACFSPEDARLEGNSLRPNVNTNFNSNAANANANTTEDDEKELDKLINLPFTPEETVWRNDKLIADADANDNRTPGPNDYKLTAVLKFSKEDAEALIAKAALKHPPTDTELETEAWFPAELIAKSETSGKSTIKGLSYSAETFAKAPYMVGSLVRITETEYFVLKLQTQ